eukprot:4473740-Pleurochrysis_carterae.AAC.3
MRASHSNFGQCNDCDRTKNERHEFRTSHQSYTKAEVAAVKERLFQHIYDMRKERRAAMALHRECVGRPTEWLFEYDDKCSSQYTFLPSPKGGRETALSAGRYKYRTNLQANLCPGAVNRLSIVPPCLRTGANFGCTAFFGALLRAQELAKLGEVVYRQTDGGSDNDAIVTHVMHWLLVHMGVVEKVVWLRLKSKHSHNLADRVFSMIWEKLWGKKGTGCGCKSPWELEQIIKDALKSRLGETEMAWHWANYDWDQWYRSCACVSSEFGDISKMRYWEYTYDLIRSSSTGMCACSTEKASCFHLTASRSFDQPS